MSTDTFVQLDIPAEFKKVYKRIGNLESRVSALQHKIDELEKVVTRLDNEEVEYEDKP